MTAQELILILSELEPETEVFVKHTASDYWRTELASEINDGEMGFVKYSNYHRQDQVDKEEEESSREVFLLEISQTY